MSDDIKQDPNNARNHGDRNKEIIRESLRDLGTGRSVVVDADGVLIAGNGVFEQAESLGIPHRIIESDGSELIVIKRTDLSTDDDKRIALAIAHKRSGDPEIGSTWDDETLFGQLSYLDSDLRGIVGFNDIEFDSLANSLNGTATTPPDMSDDLKTKYVIEAELEDEEKLQALYEELTERGIT